MREETEGARRVGIQVHHSPDERSPLQIPYVLYYLGCSYAHSLSYNPVPVKYEQVVFCGLSDFQLSLYRLFISSPEIQALLRGVDSQPLKAINILKKLCNHPELLDLPNDLRGSGHLIPEGFNGPGQHASAKGRDRNQSVHCEWSGKFMVLERFVCVRFSSTRILKAMEVLTPNSYGNQRQNRAH